MLGCGYVPLGSPRIPHTVAPLTQHAPPGEPLLHSSHGYPCPDGVISSQGTESHPFLKILLCAKEGSGRELISGYHQVRHNPHGASLPFAASPALWPLLFVLSAVVEFFSQRRAV